MSHSTEAKLYDTKLNDLLSCFKCNIKIFQILQQNAITVQWKKIFALFHCMIMKMETKSRYFNKLLYKVFLNMIKIYFAERINKANSNNNDSHSII